MSFESDGMEMSADSEVVESNDISEADVDQYEPSDNSEILEDEDLSDVQEDTEIFGNPDDIKYGEADVGQDSSDDTELLDNEEISDEDELFTEDNLNEDTELLSQDASDSNESTGKDDNLGNWDKTSSEITYEENLEATNPNYNMDESYQINCQRCVPTYEMRSRGYDVTALPCTEEDDYLSYHPYDAWENADVQVAEGNGLEDIQNAMNTWGDGSRAQVCLQWENGEGGHTFFAEQKEGATRFVDPQTGDTDCAWYFDEAKQGTVTFCRIDNLKPSSNILKCCKGVEKK